MTLSDFLVETKQSATDLASAMGCETSTITRLLRGERRPSLDLAFRIEQATGGRVAARDFSSPSEPAGERV